MNLTCKPLFMPQSCCQAGLFFLTQPVSVLGSKCLGAAYSVPGSSSSTLPMLKHVVLAAPKEVGMISDEESKARRSGGINQGRILTQKFWAVKCMVRSWLGRFLPGIFFSFLATCGDRDRVSLAPHRQS